MPKIPELLNRIVLLFLLLLTIGGHHAMAQGIPALHLDLKKPKKFEEKKLGSEKTDDTKFTIPRRFVQNTVTKFNWHFNASEKLKEVLERAKLEHRDDYTQLLSFYNYSLDATARQKQELDSVIYKANAGILLHDLRNSWVDNLYMLMGQAYYFRKEFDTAYLTFQYINYAFAPKEKDGYDKPIGSNANEGGNAFSIATKEKNDILHQMWRQPPSRNSSFLWQIRTYLAQEAYPEAAGLLETLSHDPLFPERLHNSLMELKALWFYQQSYYDSAAVYLEKALPNAGGREEKARWEYLIGQLYEKAGQPDNAALFFEKTVKLTLNPVLEVYARLNAIRQNKGDQQVIDENLKALQKMSRKERFGPYRDIIFYAAAQMQLERPDSNAARALLLQSTKAGTANSADPLQKSRSFLQLANLSYAQGLYSDAQRFYDSVTDQQIIPDMDAFKARKNALTEIVGYEAVIHRQDSLQQVAAMPEADREKYIRKLVRQIRKEKGLKEEELNAGNTAEQIQDKNAFPDLFGNNSKGEWYFDNAALKAKGLTEFRSKWGNRPNVDNWQRINYVRQNIRNADSQPAAGQPVAGAAGDNEISYEAFLNKLPLTEATLKQSNDSISTAMIALGNGLLNSLEEYRGAIRVYNDFLKRFPDNGRKPEVLFKLYYCYLKTGQQGLADSVLQVLNGQYPDNDFTLRANHPEKEQPADSLKQAMTNDYNHIYTLFIEGHFSEAEAAKNRADSLYSHNYWTPQLLYIESIYLIKQRSDDSAKKVLNDIVRTFPENPMAEKAKIMLDVLGRRAQIEKHLREMTIERPKEDSVAMAVNETAKPAADSLHAVQPPAVTGINTDSLAQKAAAADKTTREVQPKTATDTVQVKKQEEKPVSPEAYQYKPDAAQMVVIVLDKVDPVFVSEARNAFNRYNQQNYYNQPLQVNPDALSDSVKLILVSPFANAQEAKTYLNKTGKIAASAIVPWLPAAKMSFLIISQDNLEKLKARKDLDVYRSFLRQNIPDLFGQEQQ